MSKQLTFNDIVYTSCLLNHKSSYSISNSYLKINNNKKVSVQAINKRRKNMDFTLVDDVNNNLLDNIYTSHGNSKLYKGRMIAVDASQINLDKNLRKDGFVLSRSGNYCIGKLSSLYDIDKGIPINYSLSKSFNERQILMEQLKYVNENDTLIMDGGYYSKDLVNTLINRNINFIFRLRCSSILIKNNDLNVTFDIVSTNDDTKYATCKIIKFEKKDYDKIETIHLLTNLIKHKSTTLTNKYWTRWSVETDFRKLKYDILYEKIRSKSEHQVMIDIKIANFIGIVSAQLENFGKIKDGYKINTKNTLELLHTQLLHLFIYKKKTKEIMTQILTIMNIIVTTIEKIRKKRMYPRIRVFPSTKWNVNGNRFGPG